MYIPIAAFYGTALLVMLVGTSLEGHLRPRQFGVGLIGLAAMLFVPAWLVWRGFQLRVVITPTEVVLHEVLGIERFALGEVLGFEIDQRSGFPVPETRLRLLPGRHGIPRTRPVVATSPGVDGFRWNGARNMARNIAEMAPVIDAMNAELDRRRSAGVTSTD